MKGGAFIKKVLARWDIGLFYLSQAEIDPLAHNSADSMEAYYADRSKARTAFLENRHRFFREILELAAGQGVEVGERSVADAGCGTGELLAYLAEGDAPPKDLTGYEYVDSARALAQTACPAAAIASLDLYEGVAAQHDVVFCLEVLEHLEYPERALETLRKMTREGGALIVTVPDGRYDTYGGHSNFWSPTSWRRFLERECGKGCPMQTGVLHSGDIRVNWAILRG